MIRNLAALGLVVATLAPQPAAQAFNSEGHKIVAAIAWRKLSPARRAEIVTVLRQHPRFAQDFAASMPRILGAGSSADQDRWIFCQAAIWPDIARGLPAGERAKYHRPRWHYINLPVFWDAAQAQEFAEGVEANLSFNFPSSLSPDKFNAVQAIKHSLTVVKNSQSPAEQKAIHYCWLIHVVADLHQPLHSAALFSLELFPGGDKGGNAIEVRDGDSGARTNLHSFWDGLLGKSQDFDDAIQAAALAVDEHPADFNATFVGLPHDAWSTECQQAALASAYGPLLSEIAQTEEAGEELERITLSSSYHSSSAAVARRQAVIAGARLAGVLDEVRESPAPHFAAGRELTIPAAIAALPRARRSEETRSLRAAASDLPNQLASLEAEVRLLRREVARLTLALSRRDPASRALTTAAVPEDDGEQCTCGADDQEAASE